eukprot:UN02419
MIEINIKPSKIDAVNGAISDVKLIMFENIENILQRGEQLEVLVEKAESLNETAYDFRRQTVELETEQRTNYT